MYHVYYSLIFRVPKPVFQKKSSPTSQRHKNISPQHQEVINFIYDCESCSVIETFYFFPAFYNPAKLLTNNTCHCSVCSVIIFALNGYSFKYQKLPNTGTYGTTRQCSFNAGKCSESNSLLMQLQIIFGLFFQLT